MISWRSTLLTTVVLLGLAWLGFFAYRVRAYANLIHEGNVKPEDLTFLQDISLSTQASTEPIPHGQFRVESSDDPTLGSDQAPVTIVEFADFGCPYSKKESYIIRSFVEQNPDKVRFIYRDFPLPDLHPQAFLASEAANCAKDQGKFWEYHDKIYLNQDAQTVEDFYRFARETNLDMSAFRQCLSTHKYAKEILEDAQAGAQAGVRGTPTFFFNGHRVPGAVPEAVLQELVKQLSPTP